MRSKLPPPPPLPPLELETGASAEIPAAAVVLTLAVREKLCELLGVLNRFRAVARAPELELEAELEAEALPDALLDAVVVLALELEDAELVEDD